jgi:signal transduction histidine kinase
MLAGDLFAQAPDLSNIPDSRGRIKALLDYCSVLRLNKNSDPANYIKLQKAALSGLQLVKDNDAEDRADFSEYAALGYYYQVKFDSAQYFFYQSLHNAQQAKSVKLIAGASEALMSVNFQLQQPDKVEECKNILQSIADTTKNKSLLKDIYSAFGSYYQHKSFYSTAQDYYIRSIQIREKEVDTANDPKAEFDYAIQCDQLSKLYLNTNMPDKSIAALRNGERFADISPLVKNRLLSSFVEAFATSGNIDSALSYHNQLELNAGDQSPFSSEIVSSNLNVAIYYIGQKQYEKALPYLNRGVDIAAKTRSPLLIFQGQMIKGQYLEETGSNNEAIALLTQSLPVARQLDKQLYATILRSMALSYKGLDDEKSALQYYEQYSQLQDTLTKEKASRTFADLETHYQTNEKENRIVSLNQKNELDRLELKQASNTRTILILGLISLGVFSLLLYFTYRNKEKLNKILNQRNAQLDELNNQLSIANETKAKLFGVISHDLRAPVSRIVNLLHLQKENSQHENEQVRNQYAERINKASENVLETMEDLLLWSKSQMQNFVPRFKEVKLLPLITQEMALFEEQIKEKRLEVHIKVPPEIYQTTDENFLAVIVRNLVQNSINQCNDNAAITIQANANTLSITNPAGSINTDELNSVMQQTQVSSNQSGLGLQIVKDLSARIGVKIFYEQPEKNSVRAVLTWS